VQNELQMENEWAWTIKALSLVILVFQNAWSPVIMGYSKTRVEGTELQSFLSYDHLGQPYLTSTAIVCSEFAKLIFCLIVLGFQQGSFSNLFFHLHQNIVEKRWDTLKMGIPGTIYTIQNTLLFMALSNLDSFTVQITLQLKILSASVFSVIILKRHLSLSKWLALVLLMVGVTFVQLESSGKQQKNASGVQGNYEI
jgi:UDP-sugar transporter A1/2/3